mmetsp:Transcript_10090/g.22135  ORF Transcript_10090/g.22135 Transcript_10090/m.22135 type:complete len:221 (+) Transcript_10090:1576-2238(+)
MLQALEEYSSRATQFGEVTLQALRLRRALATSMWNSSGGVLNQVCRTLFLLKNPKIQTHFSSWLYQFRSLSRDTVTALKFNGISTFHDVAVASEAQIEKAASRSAPFGKNLKQAVAQTLAGALRINAKIEYAAGSTLPSELICNLEDEERGMVSGKAESEVEFTLIAFTDLPGGSLLYKKNIRGPTSFQVPLPPKFGCIAIHLVSSMGECGQDQRENGNL